MESGSTNLLTVQRGEKLWGSIGAQTINGRPADGSKGVRSSCLETGGLLDLAGPRPAALAWGHTLDRPEAVYWAIPFATCAIAL